MMVVMGTLSAEPKSPTIPSAAIKEGAMPRNRADPAPPKGRADAEEAGSPRRP